jgi:ribosomal protein S18 acetylase RimI-like enzyme
MSGSSEYACLKAAHDAIPEFAERTDYDLLSKYACALKQKDGLWACYLADSGPVPYVAFVAAYDRDGAFYLWLLGVRPDFRRNGLATSLFHCYLSEGARRGYTTFVTHTHSGSLGMVRLLETAGFSQASLGLDVVEVRGEARARERLVFTLRK